LKISSKRLERMDKMVVQCNIVTALFDKIRESEGKEKWRDYMTCMENLFFVGVVDQRSNSKCVITDYVLLGSSLILVLVIAIKFLSALQFGSFSNPESHEKYVICAIPCYNEGLDSLKDTIDSVTNSNYSLDKLLLFVVVDGIVKGVENDYTTAEIVLKLFGVDCSLKKSSFEYSSLGLGELESNFAQTYSGHYPVNDAYLPILIVIKTGNPLEKQKKGNRGKRDSQCILMQFLSKMYSKVALNPLENTILSEFEKNLGINPMEYELLLWLDGDTKIDQLAISNLSSHMARDTMIAGICGETMIGNENQSWITMIQVYEYFISHHFSKSFESLFNSVTCLPGCFCMYRIKSHNNEPIFASEKLVWQYSLKASNTLHMNNLLHLGEDRYLTTLMLKLFPHMKLKFASEAKAKTIVPISLEVFISQRRRWINSTVHNLAELLLLSGMCGCGIFSMRFIVLMDLLMTMLSPAGFVYLVYTIVQLCLGDGSQVPLVTILMIASTYGLQVIIFIAKGELQHIGWMLIYILAMPIYAFVLPLYSFWHFDDFTWGNTRIIQ
jgi:chitin synthase